MIKTTPTVPVKGVFKNKRWYRLTSKNIRSQLVIIVLLSVASVRDSARKTECPDKFRKLHYSTWMVKNQFNFK